MTATPDFGAEALVFFCVAARAGGIVATAPLLSGRGIPLIAKTALCLLVASAVAPSVVAGGYALPEYGPLYLLSLAGEFLAGTISGLFIGLAYSTLVLAGEYISPVSGFGSGSILDPITGRESGSVQAIFDIAAISVFLSTAGLQKLFILGLGDSFRRFRLADFAGGSGGIPDLFIAAGSRLFSSAFSLALPILGTLTLFWALSGFLSRAASHFNMYTEGFILAAVLFCSLIAFGLPPVLDAFAAVFEAGFGAYPFSGGRL